MAKPQAAQHVEMLRDYRFPIRGGAACFGAPPGSIMSREFCFPCAIL